MNETGTWRQLLGPANVGTSTVLAGGVALYATNEFITISLLPSAVADIGGQRFYSWVTTVYLVASVVAATTVSPILTRLGPRVSYLGAMSVFAAGTVLCALAPAMEVLLVGRTVQGLGGGVLAGLGYAVINAALPQALWTKASALVAAMWGVGTLLGPAAGGLFAQFGLWRWAFGFLLVATAAVAVLVPFALAGRRPGEEVAPFRIPIWSLLLLGAAALTVSVAGIPRNLALTAALLLLGVALMGIFLVVDRRVKVSVLPRSAFGPGPLKWIYLSLGVLMAVTMVDMYVPLFGQRLAHLVPVVAGFLGVAVSVGWTTGEIASASLRSPSTARRVVAVAPAVMAVGLGTAAATQMVDAPPWVVAIWVFALLTMGVGVGMAWPHLSAWAMAGDAGDSGTAAAAINTVQLMCGAFGAGLAGVVVNLGHGGDESAARSMYGVFAVLALVGVVATVRATRPARLVAAAL
ncbi:MFS transporter [Mycobacterium sp. MS1601]|uniref:MFS transporter n=1 Tax=Mycobacterium sp. MS1601 TaxID=1936029 RepID=UPI0009791F87|nr:MFS transporter [Mycobacterium sp. MS1601]AQA05051.1 MFS transporter [Mycobacterium sp. MS1601]